MNLRGVWPAPGPARRFAVLALMESAGNGVFLTCSAIFLVRVVGLPAGGVGVGLSVAGLAGFAAVAPLGRLADRVGAGRVLVAAHAALAVLFAGYPLVRGLGSFVVVAAVVSVCEVAANPLRASLMHASVDERLAVRVQAQTRSAFNLGFMVGAAAAAFALARPGYPAFVAVSAANALAQAACAVIVLRLRPGRPVAPSSDAPGPAPGRGALRDPRFVALALISGLMSVHTTVLVLGVPLWLVAHTRAPAGVTSALIVVNTLLVLLLQVSLSRGAETVRGAARGQRDAGLVLAAACLAYATGAGRPAVPAIVALLAGTVLLTVGEIRQSAGGWGLSFALPPPGRQGEYQAVFALGPAVAQFTGPAAVTFLVMRVGVAGWLVLAAVFVLLGQAGAWLARGRAPASASVPSSTSTSTPAPVSDG